MIGYASYMRVCVMTHETTTFSASARELVGVMLPRPLSAALQYRLSVPCNSNPRSLCTLTSLSQFNCFLILLQYLILLNTFFSNYIVKFNAEEMLLQLHIIILNK